MHRRRIGQCRGATRAPRGVPVGDNHLDTMMPLRDAVGGIIVYGVKLLSGLPSGRKRQTHAFNGIMASRSIQRHLPTYCRRHCGGTVGRLSLPLYRHCLRHCLRHCRPTVGTYCQCVQYSCGSVGWGLSAARWGGAVLCRTLLARSEQSCYTLLSTLRQKKRGRFPCTLASNPPETMPRSND